MNRLLLIANFNGQLKALFDALSVYFSVQLCLPKADDVKAIAAFYEPECTLVIADGLTDENEDVFRMLERYTRNAPVVVQGEYAAVSRFSDVISTKQFARLISPRDNTTVVDMILNKIYSNAETETAPANKPVIKPRSIKNVLFVDDSPVVLRTLRNMLQDNFSVAVATSGFMALDQINRKKPDIVFLDYEMPTVDGKKTLELIRADKNWADLPVVFLTAHSERSTIEALMSLGPAGYILKPATADKLLEMINKISSAG